MQIRRSSLDPTHQVLFGRTIDVLVIASCIGILQQVDAGAGAVERQERAAPSSVDCRTSGTLNSVRR
jgi:hypothetical protein